MLSFWQFRRLLTLAIVAILISCGGKAGENTTTTTQVDTVRVVVRDTIRDVRVDTVRVVVRDTIYIRTENVAELPDDFSYLKAYPRKFKAGISIEINYLSSFGARLNSDTCHTWRPPNKIMVQIKNTRRVVLYEAINPTYQIETDGVRQYGLRIFIPKSEIPTIYGDYPSFRYTTHIAIRYGDRTYTN